MKVADEIELQSQHRSRVEVGSVSQSWMDDAAVRENTLVVRSENLYAQEAHYDEDGFRMSTLTAADLEDSDNESEVEVQPAIPLQDLILAEKTMQADLEALRAIRPCSAKHNGITMEAEKGAAKKERKSKGKGKGKKGKGKGEKEEHVKKGKGKMGMSMTPKCVYSRAYHKKVRELLASGTPKHKTSKLAKKAGNDAVAALESEGA